MTNAITKKLLARYEIKNVTQLEALLTRASDSYYNTGRTLMSNSEFDTLVEVLREKRPSSKFFKQVRARVRKQESALPYLMPSLTKLFADTPAKFNAWTRANPGPYVLMDKLDGVGVELTWDADGYRLFLGGDADSGFEATHLVPHIRLPRVPKTEGALRGELIISKQQFASLWSGKYKNARNLVAGISNKSRGIHEALQSVDLVAFDILHKRLAPSKALSMLKTLGFHAVEHKRVTALSLDAASKYLRTRGLSGDHLIDGLVIAADKPFPLTASDPKSVIAFKMPSDGNYAEATVQKIDWNASKYGKLIPRVFIDPVELAGVTVTKATAFNARYVVDNKIGKGAVVSLIRSGEVIPDIQKVLKAARKADLPDPKVFGDYDWDENGVNFVLHDAGASDQAYVKRVTAFFKDGLAMKGFAEKTAQKLLDAGYSSIEEILNMESDDFDDIPGWKTNAHKYAVLFQKGRSDVDPVLASAHSGFFSGKLGTTKLRAIYKAYPELVDFPTMRQKFAAKTVNRRKLVDMVLALPSFADTTATIFADGYIDWLKFVTSRSVKNRLTFKKMQKAASVKLDGQVVVFTGVRDPQLKAYIESNGGKVTGSVSKNTTHLIAKNPEDNSEKLRKARDLGIAVLSLDQYKKRYVK